MPRVAAGQYVLHIGFQPQDPVVRDTPRFDQLMEITERAIERI